MELVCAVRNYKTAWCWTSGTQGTTCVVFSLVKEWMARREEFQWTYECEHRVLGQVARKLTRQRVEHLWCKRCLGLWGCYSADNQHVERKTMSFLKVKLAALQSSCQIKSWRVGSGLFLNEQFLHYPPLPLCLSRGLFNFYYEANPWIKDIRHSICK